MLARSSSAWPAHSAREAIVSPVGGQVFEQAQVLVQEPGQPHALPLALAADEVHAVVPVAGAHQWQSVPAETQPVLDRADAVFVESRGFRRTQGLIVVGLFVWAQFPAFDKGHLFVEHPRVARRLYVLAGRIRQPEIVVGRVGPHSLPAGRMPPVLDVTLAELALGTAQQMLAREPGDRIEQGHRVLQLIAEAVGAARLVVAAATPVAGRRGSGRRASRWRARRGRGRGSRCTRLRGPGSSAPILLPGPASRRPDPQSAG